MERQGEEVHVETDEVRGGSTPHVVRWILGISLVAVIVLLSAVWIFGAASQGDIEEERTATGMIDDSAERSDEEAMILQEDATDIEGTPESAVPPEDGVLDTIAN